MSSVPDPVYDLDAALAQGYSGFEVDPTPNANYTLQTPQDAPTPETDAASKKDALDRAQAIRLRLSTDVAPDAPQPIATETTGSSSASESSEG